MHRVGDDLGTPGVEVELGAENHRVCDRDIRLEDDVNGPGTDQRATRRPRSLTRVHHPSSRPGPRASGPGFIIVNQAGTGRGRHGPQRIADQIMAPGQDRKAIAVGKKGVGIQCRQRRLPRDESTRSSIVSAGGRRRRPGGLTSVVPGRRINWKRPERRAQRRTRRKEDQEDARRARGINETRRGERRNPCRPGERRTAGAGTASSTRSGMRPRRTSARRSSR